MNEEKQKQIKQISDENEADVRKWFETSGFVGKRLDTGSSKQGKTADWRFTKHDLIVLCEVKTVFSGGQSGLTREEYERRRLEAKRKFDFYKARAKDEGTTLIVFKEELEYIEGKVAYSGASVTKEAEFNDFLEDVRGQLEADEDINHLPFSISISIGGMYVVAKGEEREKFIRWLKDFALWAHTNHNTEHPHSTLSFPFRYRQKAPDGTIQRGIEATVHVWGPLSGGQLEVGFSHSGVPYHEKHIAKTIGCAMPQLAASIERENVGPVLPVIAVWSESRQLSFGNLLINDHFELQLNNLPNRYYLFDWAFSEYPELAAIILFEIHRDGDIWNPTPNDKVYPVGFVITNPNLPEAENALKKAITENSVFITGLASDPLDGLIS